jgi:hypothetical protein
MSSPTSLPASNKVFIASYLEPMSYGEEQGTEKKRDLLRRKYLHVGRWGTGCNYLTMWPIPRKLREHVGNLKERDEDEDNETEIEL